MDNKFNDDFSDEKSFQDFEFDSFADFDDIGAAGTMNNNGVDFINVEEYAFQELDLDAKYRSIQAVNPSVFSSHQTSMLKTMGPPQLSKATTTSHHANNDQLLTKAPLSIIVKPSTMQVTVPDQPFYVAVTQFTTVHNVDTLIAIIENDLSAVLEVSYQFYHANCRWEGVYLSGPTRCKFEINVYKNDEGSYTIEGNRLCGDSFPFSTIFRGLRSKFSSDKMSSSPTSVMNFQFIPLPEAALELSSDEIAAAVTPIIAMAASGKCESQVTAAQILCDLSMQQNMLEVMCKADCVHALVQLMRVDFNFCNQHAVCALANLSSSRSCQEVLLHDQAFLKLLLQLCSDGCHNTAEMRREGARLLANICSARASAMLLVQLLGQEDVTQWVLSVDTLRDERLRLHAERAKNALNPCLCEAAGAGAVAMSLL